ncbi:MAG TPA: transcription antitermination factor NusB [Sediminibacterium sp.]|nr:transcription antitermination factor NusB [Sediminibacterium sp.]
MISRRNIRVKVMQLLYMMEVSDNDTGTIKNPVETLRKQFDTSNELFVYLLYFLTSVARYAETSARQRASRNLPSADDLNVNTKISGNLLLWQILENPSYQAAVESFHVNEKIDKDLVKKIFDQLTTQETYLAYIREQSRDKAREREILKLIFTDLMLPDESFMQHLEELFSNWDDDADMMVQLTLQFLQKPQSFNFQQLLGAEKWQFAQSLLQTTMDKKEYCLELIRPKLKNWDSERIAHLDMILMRMGVCELLYFETIPTKVTINEYIDLAKAYSTPQSGQFVNGILDNIHKEMVQAGKINKIDFKNKEV